MRIKMLIVVSTLLIFASTLAAQTTPLRVLCSNGMKAVVEQLKPRIEGELGRPLTIQFGTSALIRQRIEAGDAFDVVVLTSEVIGELAKAGRVTPASVLDLGRSGIGFGVRAGAAKPDVRTPEAVKQTLMNAKSLTWVSVGASRVHIEKMLEGLGIAKDVQSKIRLTQGVDESVASVADGKTEMILTLTSEILPSKSLQYVGPFPQKFQNYVSFSGAISPKSSASAAGAAVLKQLRSPGVVRVYESMGMELPVVGDPPARPAAK